MNLKTVGDVKGSQCRLYIKAQEHASVEIRLLCSFCEMFFSHPKTNFVNIVVLIAREPNPQFLVNLHSDAVKGCDTSM